jgi:putative SOS response-associated peptidase YedK
MFKAAFAARRCLVPAAAHYEWRDDPEGKTPFAVAEWMGIPSLLAPDNVLRLWPVDKRVGNVRTDGLELLEPHAPAETPALL